MSNIPHFGKANMNTVHRVLPVRKNIGPRHQFNRHRIPRVVDGVKRVYHVTKGYRDGDVGICVGYPASPGQ